MLSISIGSTIGTLSHPGHTQAKRVNFIEIVDSIVIPVMSQRQQEVANMTSPTKNTIFFTNFDIELNGEFEYL